MCSLCITALSKVYSGWVAHPPKPAWHMSSSLLYVHYVPEGRVQVVLSEVPPNELLMRGSVDSPITHHPW